MRIEDAVDTLNLWQRNFSNCASACTSVFLCRVKDIHCVVSIPSHFCHLEFYGRLPLCLVVIVCAFVCAFYIYLFRSKFEGKNMRYSHKLHLCVPFTSDQKEI